MMFRVLKLAIVVRSLKQICVKLARENPMYIGTHLYLWGNWAKWERMLDKRQIFGAQDHLFKIDEGD